MSFYDDIAKALVAHGAWRQRLNAAIASGQSEFQVPQVQVDNRCDFGKWLYTLPANMQVSDHYKKAQKLHAEFHAEAARILDLALRGHKNEALKALDPGSRYAGLSGQLAMTLGQWKLSLPGC